MIPEERQALREQHQRNFLEEHKDGEMCLNCLTPWRCNGPHGEDTCASCFDERGFGVPYPCDVIKVLDAWEASKATYADCQHVTQPNSTVARAVSLGYQCPLCGEKV